MKRILGVSIVAAALLFVGCGEKKEHKSAAVSSAAQSSSVATQKGVIEEALPGTPVKAKVQVHTNTQASSEATQSSEAATSESVVEKATKAVQKKVEGIKEQSKEAAQEVKKKAQALLPGVAAPAAQQQASVDGKALFKKCASCHGPDGKRKALGKSAPIAGMGKEELVKILQEYKKGERNKYGMGGLMKGQVAGLSDADIQALADYISSL